MMRGTIVIITALLSVLFLKRKQYLHHGSSLLLIVTGLAIVGYTGIQYSKLQDKDSDLTPTSLLGVVLLILA